MRLLRLARWLLLLALALLILPPLARGDDADIEQRKRDLLLKLRTHRAIDQGAVWVAGRQQRDGSFALRGNAQMGPFPQSRHTFGETALATYTLAHCGYTAERDEVKKAVSYLRKRYRSMMKGDYWPQASSYSLSLVVLALHTLYATEPEPVEANARYGRGVLANPCRYPAWAQKMIQQILDWLLENQAPKGLFRYPDGLSGGPPGGPPPGRGPGGPGGPAGAPGPGSAPARGADFYGPEDLSNSQYVLLALWVGTRCGYEVKKKTCEKIAKRLLAWQEPDGPDFQRRWDPLPKPTGTDSRYGVPEPPEVFDEVRGFGYTPGDSPTGSMTSAGLSSLVIIKAILLEQHTLDPKLRKTLDKGIWDAIAWHTWYYSIVGNPPGRGPMWHYYYLYGLERACVIAGKQFLGDHDWYKEGASMLVDAQQKDGRWSPDGFGNAWGGGQGPAYRMDLLDSCFALLFLKRAALTPKVPLLPKPTITPGD